MNVHKEEPLSPSVEALLASERMFEPQPENVRWRAVARARAVVQGGAPGTRAKAWLSGWGLKTAVSGVVVTTALSAAAIRASHRTKASAPDGTPAFEIKSRAPNPPGAPTTTAPPTTQDDGVTSTSKNEAPVHTAPAAPRTLHERYALELKVLQPAREAVARGDFSSALATLAEHERRFPNGQLAEEREALRVQALSGLGRTEEAGRAAAAFRERFPASVLLSRMRSLQRSP
jgi:TolA-binding protein